MSPRSKPSPSAPPPAPADTAPASRADDTLPFEAPVPTGAPAGAAPADLAGLLPEALADMLEQLGERRFRAQQVFDWLHGKRVADVAAMSNLGRELRARLAAETRVDRPRVSDVKVAGDGTRKYQLETADGHVIEAVWIPHASGPGRHALCISSQVGCAMGCTFCATAALKLTRHLRAGEIVGQVYAVLADLEANLPDDPPPPAAKLRGDFSAVEGDDDGADTSDETDDDGRDGDDARAAAAGRPGRRRRRIQNIVYMGMGEPLHNLGHVLQSIHLLTHAGGLGLAPRRITVSTSGLAPALSRLGRETGVHLAVSLNATTDEVRRTIMPVNRRYPIETLLDACRAFPVERRRRVTFEYVLLRDVNDTDDDAQRLATLLAGFPGKVNLIPFNPHPLSPFGRPDDARVAAFREILTRRGLRSFVRTTRGLDIDAACGMLGAKKLEAARGALPVLP